MYIEALRRKETQGSKKTARYYETLFERHIYPSAIANLPASSLTSDDFVDIQREMLKVGTKRTADDLRAAMATAYKGAMDAPLDATKPRGAAQDRIRSNPIVAVKKLAKPRVRKRPLSNHDLYYYWTLLDATGHSCSDIKVRTLRLNLLLGGQRIAQLVRVPVSNLDLHAGTILLYDEKGRRDTPRPHLLPLTPRATEEARWFADHVRDRKSSNLFPGTRANTILSVYTVSAFVKEISNYLISQEKITQPFQARDIRATVETRLAELDVRKDIRAQLQSHDLGGVQERHYDDHDYMNQKRKALLKWDRHLTSLKTIVFGAGEQDDLQWLSGWLELREKKPRKSASRAGTK